MVGCEDVPGFEAVALGNAVDSVLVEKGVVTSAATLCRDNCQLIGEPINRTRSSGKKNRD